MYLTQLSSSQCGELAGAPFVHSPWALRTVKPGVKAGENLQCLTTLVMRENCLLSRLACNLVHLFGGFQGLVFGYARTYFQYDIR